MSQRTEDPQYSSVTLIWGGIFTLEGATLDYPLRLRKNPVLKLGTGRVVRWVTQSCPRPKYMCYICTCTLGYLYVPYAASVASIGRLIKAAKVVNLALRR